MFFHLSRRIPLFNVSLSYRFEFQTSDKLTSLVCIDCSNPILAFSKDRTQHTTYTHIHTYCVGENPSIHAPITPSRTQAADAPRSLIHMCRGGKGRESKSFFIFFFLAHFFFFFILLCYWLSRVASCRKRMANERICLGEFADWNLQEAVADVSLSFFYFNSFYFFTCS